MKRVLENIEGVTKADAQRLRVAGIRTIGELIEKARTREGREALAAVTRYTPQQLLEWTNIADMLRIKGLSEKAAELLRASGITTSRSNH